LCDYLSDAPRRGALPAPVFFMDRNSKTCIERSIAEGRKHLLFGEELVYLGAYGVVRLCGLRVAFLSGFYDQDVFAADWGLNAFDGANYTRRAVDELKREACSHPEPIDIFVTSEWPDRFWSRRRCHLVTPTIGEQHTSPAVRELFFELKPRYHICASADVHVSHEASQGPYRFISRFVALAAASNERAGDWWQLLEVG